MLLPRSRYLGLYDANWLLAAYWLVMKGGEYRTAWQDAIWWEGVTWRAQADGKQSRNSDCYPAPSTGDHVWYDCCMYGTGSHHWKKLNLFNCYLWRSPFIGTSFCYPYRCWPRKRLWSFTQYTTTTNGLMCSKLSRDWPRVSQWRTTWSSKDSENTRSGFDSRRWKLKWTKQILSFFF